MIINEKPDFNSSYIPITMLLDLSEEEQKNEINKNYLSNLSNRQKISIKFKDENEKDKFLLFILMLIIKMIQTLITTI